MYDTGEEYDKRLCWSAQDRHAAPVQYAFKVFNDSWARYGEGPKWPALDFNGDYDDRVAVLRAIFQAIRDPTEYGLATLLSRDAAELTDGSIEFWLAMVFGDYSGNQIVLPLEIQTGKLCPQLQSIHRNVLIHQFQMTKGKPLHK